MDICVESPKVEYEALKIRKKSQVMEESSADIRERVCKARAIQTERYQGTNILSNSMMGAPELERYCLLGEKEEQLMKQAFTNLSLTARSYHKILKVARTIADLEGEEKIQAAHLAEAVGYRTLDKKYWGR